MRGPMRLTPLTCVNFRRRERSIFLNSIFGTKAQMKASDVMTRRVITVGRDASILEAARLMLQQKVSGLPVVDDQRKRLKEISYAGLRPLPNASDRLGWNS